MEADSPAMLSNPDLLDPVNKSSNSGIRISDHERSKSQTLMFMNI